MRKNRTYRRLLSDREKKELILFYKPHLDERGILPKLQRERLMGLKKMERGLKDPAHDRESDYWYKLRTYIAKGFLDLELFVKVASDSQLEELFKPLTKDDHLNIDLIRGLRYAEEYKKSFPSASLNAKYNRTDLASILDLVLIQQSSTQPEKWKTALAASLVSIGLSCLGKRKQFNSTLHKKLFAEVLKSIGLRTDVL